MNGYRYARDFCMPFLKTGANIFDIGRGYTGKVFLLYVPLNIPNQRQSIHMLMILLEL